MYRDIIFYLRREETNGEEQAVIANNEDDAKTWINDQEKLRNDGSVADGRTNDCLRSEAWTSGGSSDRNEVKPMLAEVEKVKSSLRQIWCSSYQFCTTMRTTGLIQVNGR